MRKILSLTVAVLTLAPLYADMTQKDVAEIAAALKAGKPTKTSATYPAPQTLTFVHGEAVYVIDFRLKLCFGGIFSSGGSSGILIPCKQVKDGFPLIASLISWEK